MTPKDSFKLLVQEYPKFEDELSDLLELDVKKISSVYKEYVIEKGDICRLCNKNNRNKMRFTIYYLQGDEELVAERLCKRYPEEIQKIPNIWKELWEPLFGERVINYSHIGSGKSIIDLETNK